MSLKLMYITNRTDVAKIAQQNGVDRIFVDMEYIGKDLRQGGMDSVQNHHTVNDVRSLRKVIDRSELLVRVNPIHSECEKWCSSQREIDDVIEAGADIVMLPMAKTLSEIEQFVGYVGKRAKVMILVETKEAHELLAEIVKIKEIDEIYIGLNDLHLSVGKKFMFELLTDGTVEKMCKIIASANKPYGFGGIARLGYGMLPAENVIAEHYRLRSSMAILSRSFCNIQNIDDEKEIAEIFERELKKIRDYESSLEHETEDFFEQNKEKTKRLVDKIVRELGK